MLTKAMKDNVIIQRSQWDILNANLVAVMTPDQKNVSKYIITQIRKHNKEEK
jgi:hypothetical protein